MLLVLPVSQSDSHLIPNAEKSFALFPPGAGHKLVVVGSPNVAEEMNRLSGSLSQYFNEASVHFFDNDNFLGWPSACNYYFQQACFHIATYNVPWFWYELDCTPLKEGWLSVIEAEYNEGPGGFLGCLEQTYRGFDGRLLDGQDAGQHMAACGVYPGDITGTVVPLRGVSETDVVWWNFLQWYIAPVTRHTHLIQNNYKTHNYRKEDGEIVCDSCNNWAWECHYNKPINPKAVILHGCKDGSLFKLLDPIVYGHTIQTLMYERGPEEQAKLDKHQAEICKPKPKSYRRGRKKVRKLEANV